VINESLKNEFQQAIKEDYGENVSVFEAGQILTDFVGYFDKLAEIHHKDLTERNDIIEISNQT
jgi:hypothetical protein